MNPDGRPAQGAPGGSMARMIADVPALRMSSELNRVMERAAALEKSGQRIVHLERGEPDFDTPAHIVAALAQAARAGQTHYPDARGSKDLREVLAEKLGHENHIPCTARDVVVTVGGTHALSLALQSLLGPGDEVLALSPYWMALPKIVGLTREGRMRELPVYLDIQSGALDPAAFYARVSEAVGPSTRGFYLNTPHNPTP